MVCQKYKLTKNPYFKKNLTFSNNVNLFFATENLYTVIFSLPSK